MNLFGYSAQLTALNTALLLFLTCSVIYLMVHASKEGFYADDSGASMRYATARSDGYANSAVVIPSERHPSVSEGFGAYEPPVFWNAGSYGAVDTYMQNPSNQVVDPGLNYHVKNLHYMHVKHPPLPAEGMMDYNKLSGGGAYEGMSDRFSDDALVSSALGF